MSPASDATRADAARLVVLAGARTCLEGEWASDQWRAERLGASARRGAGFVSFGPIGQAWLREPVKRWSRFRLATGCSFSTIAAGALALGRFSRFLADAYPQVDEPAGITRPLLEDFLAWLLEEDYSASTRALTCSMVRVFFDACHRHDWLAGSPRRRPSTSMSSRSTTKTWPGSSPSTSWPRSSPMPPWPRCARSPPGTSWC
jgi:hypothetical protein